MLKSLPFRLLLVLTFAVGQWLALVHATQHELTASAEKADTCVVCSLGHGSGGVAALPALPVDLSSKSLVPRPLLAVALPALRAARARSRAPPSFLA